MPDERAAPPFADGAFFEAPFFAAAFLDEAFAVAFRPTFLDLDPAEWLRTVDAFDAGFFFEAFAFFSASDAGFFKHPFKRVWSRVDVVADAQWPPEAVDVARLQDHILALRGDNR